MKPLSPAQVVAALKTLPGWSGTDREICRKLYFEDFRGAMDFMQMSAEGIEQRNHHPVWTNKYTEIEIRLNTFDVGKYVTEKDIDLARFLNSVLDKHGAEFGFVEG